MRLAQASRRTGLDVRAVGDGAGQRVRDVVARLEPESHRERRRVRDRAAADRLRHRVDARMGGRRGGQAVREHGVDERVLRAHVRVAEADLPVRSVSVSTLAPDTSLPVPEVVGQRTSPMRGGAGARARREVAPSSRPGRPRCAPPSRRRAPTRRRCPRPRRARRRARAPRARPRARTSARPGP